MAFSNGFSCILILGRNFLVKTVQGISLKMQKPFHSRKIRKSGDETTSQCFLSDETGKSDMA